jgi:hypothetical protein
MEIVIAGEREKIMFEVQKISDLDLAFPAKALDLMPKYEEIPEEFKHSGNRWVKFQSDWFYRGISNLRIATKSGIDANEAMRHLGAIQGSFEPKHEHKEAAVAYLASIWFEDVSYEINEGKEG